MSADEPRSPDPAKSTNGKGRLIRSIIWEIQYPDPDREWTQRWINGRTFYATASSRPFPRPFPKDDKPERPGP